MLLPGVLRRWICQLGTPIDRWRWDGIRIDIRILENEYGALGVYSELARVKWAGILRCAQKYADKRMKQYFYIINKHRPQIDATP